MSFFKDAGRLARYDQSGDGVSPAMAAEIAWRVVPRKVGHSSPPGRYREIVRHRAIAAVAPARSVSGG